MDYELQKKPLVFLKKKKMKQATGARIIVLEDDTKLTNITKITNPTKITSQGSF